MEHINGNLILIGLMGAGKTTLGKHVAQILGRRFYDSDHEICSSSGVSIPTIFDMEGEQGFRNRESAMLNKLAAERNIVLSTGGGAVLREENRRCLRENGTVVYLHTQPEVLLERTRHDTNRPLLQVEDPLAKLKELYNMRDRIYRETAHIVIESENYQKTVDRLLNALRQTA
ncbi:shikimate kinase [Neisseria animalis]|uniref:Shikimate kinase n=1 Tax=Neisseria animalis TaxID=492 RepID=A0A5P3MRN0_NEIAN|nr:shikimate kinase [Neisseria animalis]QEY24266.1 shikimate kinase [Neisseria animalis]ROW32328.1 shikimate kinase [Neisseria animalis]VEE06653.1 shikimate kinase [Neisseria animalis]